MPEQKRRFGGSYLLSRENPISSALSYFTSVFGMGTGGTNSVLPPPKRLLRFKRLLIASQNIADDLLVLLGSTDYSAYTCSLSTR
jgi:hypothetical protein